MELVSKDFDVSKSINFTELVKNSNTIQSLHLQSKMVNILTEVFTESEQQWYIANLYMYINYHPTNDFLINLENIFKMVGFANKANAKRTIKNNFVENEDYKTTVISRDDGKFTIDEVMINANTFKNLCMLAKTDKGKNIRKYYMKIESIYNKFISEELKDEQNLLIQQIELKTLQILQDKDMKHEESLRKNRHNILIEKFCNKKCVYVAELDNNPNVIKIGSTHNINERIKDLCAKFGKCIFLQVFECDNFREIESNILHHELILKYKYKEEINGYRSKEVVKLTDQFNYKHLIEIVENMVTTVNYLTSKELLKRYELEIENKKLDIIRDFMSKGEQLSNIITLFTKAHQMPDGEVKITEYNNQETKIPTDEINTTENNQPIKITYDEIDVIKKKQLLQITKRPPKGQQIQKIDPNNLNNIIETYESMVYVLRNPNNQGFNKSGIQDAIKYSKIYRNYRWNYLGNPLNPTCEYKSQPPIRETIIQLNEDKTKIIETFTSKDIAAKKFNIGKLRMRNIIKTSEKFNSCYFVVFSKCPSNLLESYEQNIQHPHNNNSKQIKQTHQLSNNFMIFKNLNEIYIKHGICSKTIINAIENKTIYSGSLWEYV